MVPPVWTSTVPGRKVLSKRPVLASSNPHQSVGAPDFAERAAPDTGTLGVIAADRETGGEDGRREPTVWRTPKLIIESTEKKVRVTRVRQSGCGEL